MIITVLLGVVSSSDESFVPNTTLDMFYDANILSSLDQSSDNNTPITASGQSVALVENVVLDLV